MDSIDELAPVVIREEAPAPAAPAVPVPEVAPDEKQVMLTQSRLDEILKKAMGKAGATARAEAETLRTENERLRQVAAGAGSPEEIERIRGELASEKLLNQKITDDAIRQRKDLLISEQATALGYFDADCLQKLTRSNIKHDPTTNTFIVTDDAGVPKLNASGEPMSISEFYTQYGNQRKWLLRGVTLGGSGSTPSQGVESPATLDYRRFVGPGSSSKAANDLAQRNPRAYQEMKRRARADGMEI